MRCRFVQMYIETNDVFLTIFVTHKNCTYLLPNALFQAFRRSEQFSELSPPLNTTSWLPKAISRIRPGEPLSTKSTTVLYFGSSTSIRILDATSRQRHSHNLRNGLWLIDRLDFPTFRYLEVQTLTTTVIVSVSQSARPTFLLQLRWCSLLCAAVNPFLTLKFTTCLAIFCHIIFPLFVTEKRVPACWLCGHSPKDFQDLG